MELELGALLMLALAALVAGFFDTLAGGGGLITLPALLLAGLPPTVAIGTNKLQASFGTATAAFNMLRRGLVSVREVRLPFSRSVLGAALGAWAIQQVNAEALRWVVPVVLLMIGGYFLFAKGAGATERQARFSERTFSNAVVPAIGFYDGLFGPGTGSFFALGGVALRGMELVKATATAKVLNFGSNLTAFLVLLAGGKVLWSVGAE